MIPRKTLLQLPMLHRCAFIGFFSRKSIGPFHLILILLGALAHFSQDSCPLLVLVVCAFVSTALHCGHSKKSEIEFSGEQILAPEFAH